jgi:hypothetical protein
MEGDRANAAFEAARHARSPGRAGCRPDGSAGGESRHSAIDMLSPVDYEEKLWNRRAAA